MRRLRAERRVVLVDIENVVGGAVASAADAAWARDVVCGSIEIGSCDQFVIGSGPAGLVAAADGWGTARYTMQRGRDGADRALLDVMDEGLERRFAEIVLVSGDGIFADRIAEFGAQGTPTTVVAHRTALSRDLRMAAGRVIYLSPRDGGMPSALAPIRVLRPTPADAIQTLRSHITQEAA